MRKILFAVFLICFSVYAYGDCTVVVGQPVASGGAFSASDTFDRTDSNTLGNLSGGTYTWTENQGDIDIGSYLAQYGTNGTRALATIGVDRATGYVQADVNMEGSSYSEVGVVFWYEDTSNYWYVMMDDVNNYAELHQVASGSDTEQGNYSMTVDPTTTYEIKITFSAASVVVAINGTTRITHNGSFGSNSGDLGLMMYRGSTATGCANDFEAGE